MATTMIAETRHKAYMGIVGGLALAIVGRAISRSSDPPLSIAGVGPALGGWALFVWGCCHYAKIKGYSGWWGLLGFLSIVGLFILFAFPDRGRQVETNVTPSKGLLQSLIVTEWALIAVGAVVSFRTESLLPEPLQIYVQQLAEADITVREAVTSIAMLILFIVSSIGLFFFWRPARILYLVTAVVSLLATPFSGPYVDSGWMTMFDEATIIISGVILALIYYSPLKELFEKPTTS